jgi:lipoprotein NlpI
MDPKYAIAWRARAVARIHKSNLPGAAEDCEQAIQMDPRAGRGYFDRAIIECLRRDWPGALADYRRGSELAPNDRDSMRPAIWLARARIGERGAADQELAAWLDARSSKLPFNSTTNARFLLGRISEKEFLAGIQSNAGGSGTCRTLYYIGMKKLLDGDKAGAADSFRKCLATGEKPQVSYEYAQAELKELGENDAK